MIVAVLLPPSVQAQLPTGSQQTMDYMTWGTKSIDDLVTSHLDLFVEDGFRLANMLTSLLLLMAVLRWMTERMFAWHTNLDLAWLVLLLGKLATVLILLHYYNSPLPGSSYSFHQLFTHTGRLLGGAIDAKIVNDFLAYCTQIKNGMQKPTVWDMAGVIEYYYILANMAIIEGVLFVITIFGFIATGIGTLVGPLFLPCLLVSNLSSLFWRWVNSMMVYSFYQVVAKSMVFVWCHLVVTFFQHALHGDYSIGALMYLFVPFGMLNVGFIFSLTRVPALTAEYFGGIGTVGASVGASISNTVRGWM
jgi:hypothetical protein